MKGIRLGRWGSRLLIALGLVLLLAAAAAFSAALSARQAVDAAERLAKAHAAELATVLMELQGRLAEPAVELAALEALERNNSGDRQLLGALTVAGFDTVMTAQVFRPDLEELGLGEYPEPDFTTLEMLLEARRSGRALPEARLLAGQQAHLALAQRVPVEDDAVRGILLVRLPVESLVGRVTWSPDLDFLALTQGLGERRAQVWQQGSRPSREPGRSAVPGTRLSLEWHRSTQLPVVNLRTASILALAGLIMLLLGAQAGGLTRRIALPVALPAAVSNWRRRAATALKARRQPLPQADQLEPGAQQDSRAVVSGSSARETPLAAGADHAVDQPIARDEADMSLVLDSAAEAEREPPSVEQAAETEPAVRAALTDCDSALSAQQPDLLSPDTLEETGSASEDIEPDRESLTAGDDESPIADPAETGAEAEPESEPEPEPAPAPAPTPTPKADPVHSQSPAARSKAPVDPGLFTDTGILGKYGEGLDERSMTLIGQAIAAVAMERGVRQIAVARDGRLHGPVLISALIQGLRSGGVDVLEHGAIPSPILDFAALELPGQSGVMVGAGHLPAEWNGLRIMLQGQPLVGGGVHQLLDRISSGTLADGRGGLSEASVAERYIQAVTARVQLERPLKILVDCANGVAGLQVPRLLSAIGADVVPLYADVDGSFPNHLPEPLLKENLADLRLCVRNFQADLGLAVGGHGDRVVMMGPDGSVVWPDRMLLLLARELLRRQPGAVIVQDALCSPRVLDQIQALGGQVLVADPGPVAVAAALQRSGGALGATFAGQFLLPGEWNPCGDALFAACRLLEILASETGDVGATLADLPSWHSLPPSFLPTPSASPSELLEKLGKSPGLGDAALAFDNGLSMDFGRAWARLCRSPDGSGLLLRFEGDNEMLVERVRSQVRELLLRVDERLQIPF